MISFIASIIVLILGYIVYSKYVDKKFGVNDEILTPAKTKADGVDFIEMPTWRIFMIQLLNIAGLGPIFGAILGARYGETAYIWIVFGCIFLGSVHDYFSGMISIRQGGISVSEIIGKYLGKGVQNISRAITFVLLILVGAAFINGPASLLANLSSGLIDFKLWVVLIMIYYILATLLPIDKIIGAIYPFFGAALLIMAFGIGGYMLLGNIPMTELGMDSFHNFQTNPNDNILIPMLFIVVSCGAISGFHSTQSPLMARCIKKESDGRKVFFGAMIAEGIITIIWTAAAINFFGGPDNLNKAMDIAGHTPAWAVNLICNTWLGSVGAALAIIGVVACPITTGDTAYRSARLLVADIMKIEQKSFSKRLLVSIPLFAIGFGLSLIDFSMIWKYVGVLNQMLAVIFLWTSAVYMIQNKKNHLFISIPAMFLTGVVFMYFIVAPFSQGGLALNVNLGYAIGIITGLSAITLIIRYANIANKSVN